MNTRAIVQKTVKKTHLHIVPVLLVFILSSFIFFPSTPLSETRQHGSHVHGVGLLNVGVDGNTVIFELVTPAANLLGFEHAPRTDEQEEALHRAVHTLNHGDDLFVLSERAGCTILHAEVKHGMGEESHEDHAGHGEHHEGHGDEHHHDEGGHSDFQAMYRFSCSAPDQLQDAEVRLFSLFPGFEKIHVQVLTSAGQSAVQLTPRRTTIALSVDQ